MSASGGVSQRIEGGQGILEGGTYALDTASHSLTSLTLYNATGQELRKIQITRGAEQLIQGGQIKANIQTIFFATIQKILDDLGASPTATHSYSVALTNTDKALTEQSARVTKNAPASQTRASATTNAVATKTLETIYGRELTPQQTTAASTNSTVPSYQPTMAALPPSEDEIYKAAFKKVFLKKDGSLDQKKLKKELEIQCKYAMAEMLTGLRKVGEDDDSHTGNYMRNYFMAKELLNEAGESVSGYEEQEQRMLKYAYNRGGHGRRGYLSWFKGAQSLEAFNAVIDRNAAHMPQTYRNALKEHCKHKPEVISCEARLKYKDVTPEKLASQGKKVQKRILESERYSSGLTTSVLQEIREYFCMKEALTAASGALIAQSEVERQMLQFAYASSKHDISSKAQEANSQAQFDTIFKIPDMPSSYGPALREVALSDTSMELRHAYLAVSDAANSMDSFITQNVFKYHTLDIYQEIHAERFLKLYNAMITAKQEVFQAYSQKRISRSEKDFWLHSLNWHKNTIMTHAHEFPSYDKKIYSKLLIDMNVPNPSSFLTTQNFTFVGDDFIDYVKDHLESYD